jgi:hypothetical protein
MLAAAVTTRCRRTHARTHTAATAPPVATCPLGFGTARGPKLTKLHCPVCRALLFNAQRVRGCSHTFCEPCIRATRDCPVCGADVDALEANTELAGACVCVCLCVCMFVSVAAAHACGACGTRQPLQHGSLHESAGL